MTEFVSEVKTIPFNEDRIFNMLSDLSNLEKVQDRIPEDKIKDFEFDKDSCSFSVAPVGKITFQIVEREPNKTIKFTTTNSPVPLFLWIQLKQVEENDTRMKLTVRAELNPFIKPMVQNRCQDAIDRISIHTGIPALLIVFLMAQKLWEKNVQVDQEVDTFTVGKDREMDLYLAKYDVLGSMAHITMLESIGLLTKEELTVLLAELKNIYAVADSGQFVIEEGVEDVHSQVELMLTRRLGDTGKKIHSGRSRNDQVLLDLKLFTRAQIQEVVELVSSLFEVLISQSNRYKDVLLPGYTHLQIAMPSSFGLWFGAYAESLADDLQMMQAAYKVCNRNPLGSAAGYGSSFPLRRQMTTDLLGFDSLDYNVVYAQMGRGKMERTVAFAMAGIAATLSKLAFDACMFNSQNFGFIKLPDQFTTGSSIMPHKKNPDVFELTRAKCNKLQGLPQQITLISNNLPSGYFRDLQIIKEVFLPSFDELKDCLRMVTHMMREVKVNEHILDDDKYALLFSVEEVNRLVLEGVPFRDAYKQVGLNIEAGKFIPVKKVHHTHEGSIGNLCNDQVSALMQNIMDGFAFNRVNEAEQQLLS